MSQSFVDELEVLGAGHGETPEVVKARAELRAHPSTYRRRVAVCVGLWLALVLVPDVVVRHEVFFRWGRSGPFWYTAVALAMMFLWLRFLGAMASLRARIAWLAWVVMGVVSMLLPFFVVGTVRYFSYFNLDPRPIVVAYLLENPRYIGAIALTGAGWPVRLILTLGPIALLGLFAWVTRTPLQIGTKRQWNAAMVIALMVASLPFWSNQRLSRRPFPADLRGLSSMYLGTSLWAGGSELPTLPKSTRQPVAAPMPADRRDVFILIHESLSRDQVAPWAADGDPGLRTFLGEHAAHTTWFPRATTVAPVTNVALPSIVSGLGPDAPRTEFARAPLLWHEAKARGYRTALLSAEDYDFGFFRGFMVADGAGLDTVKTAADYPNLPRVNDHGVADSAPIDDALALVRATPAGEPLLIVLQFNATHYPCWSPEMGHRESHLDSDTIDPKERQRRCTQAARFVVSETARFLDGLAAAGRLERSLVIGTADHGETFAGDRPLRPVNYDENVLNVPLFVHLPEDASEEQRARLHANAEQRTSNTDIVPTVLDLWGTTPAASLTGKSLIRVLPTDRVHVSAAGCAIYEASSEGFAIYHGPWKWRITELGGAEAFNLTTDPAEHTNRIQDIPKEERQIFWAEVDRRPALGKIVQMVAQDLAR